MIEKLRQHALSSRVLAVAFIQIDDENEIYDWSCYIVCVEGINHSEEKFPVAKSGQKQNPKLAQILFPNLDIEKYRR